MTTLEDYIRMADAQATNELQAMGIFETSSVPIWIVLFTAHKADQDPEFPVGGTYADYERWTREKMPNASEDLVSSFSYYAATFCVDPLVIPAGSRLIQ